MNSIEEYQNLVSMLTKALEFYANEHNYSGNSELFSRIGMDNGSQARFALEQVKKIEQANEKIQNDYNKIINDTIESIENHPFDISDAITKLKNIDDGDKI